MPSMSCPEMEVGVEDRGAGRDEPARARRRSEQRPPTRAFDRVGHVAKATDRGYCPVVLPDVLIYGDTIRSPELRHEVPVAIGDPFLYAERDGVRHVVGQLAGVAAARRARARAASARGVRRRRASRAAACRRRRLVDEVMLRAVRGLGIEQAIVPALVPAATGREAACGGRRADARIAGSSTTAGASRTSAELAGIRRAQSAAEAGMAAARELLRRASRTAAACLEVDGEPLTSERIKIAIAQAFIDARRERRRVHRLARRLSRRSATTWARARFARARRS